LLWGTKKQFLNKIHPAVAKHAPLTDANNGRRHVIV
jgi:hypothetical protein